MSTAPLGLNARNALIRRENPQRSIRTARDKVETKRLLARCAVPVPETIALISSRIEADRTDPTDLGDRWVMKPSRGSQGRGVLVNHGSIAADRARRHALAIVDGDFSTGADIALVEPLIVPDPALAVCPIGLPDVRVIALRGRPVMAMLRIPTVASGGRSNLHQGGIGAALDIASGRVERAVHRGRWITAHPDSNASLPRLTVPSWDLVISVAMACGPALGLGYVGVDVVIAADRGPVVLEVNAFPGLEIQNVCGRPLVLDRRP
jgi:alpha-L-glutamate ligase-like protein